MLSYIILFDDTSIGIHGKLVSMLAMYIYIRGHGFKPTLATCSVIQIR